MNINKYINRLKNSNLIIMLLLDSFLIGMSIIISIFFRYDFTIPEIIAELLYPINITILLIIKIFLFKIFSLYRGLWRYTGVWDLLNILKANIFSTLALTLIFYFLNVFDTLSRSIVAIDLILTTSFICVSRLGIRLFFSNVRQLIKTDQLSNKKVVIIGAGDTGQTIIRQILNDRKSSLEIIFILDDDIRKIGQTIHGVPVIGPISKFLEFDTSFDETYICIPSATKNEMQSIIEICKKSKKPFKTLPSLSELIDCEVTISQLREVSINDLLGRKEVNLDKSAIDQTIRGQRILVTGAGGSIGSELVRQCIKFSPSLLIMIDISELNLFKIEMDAKKLDSKILFKPILCDIRDKFLIDNIFCEYKPQIVFHAAAYKHVPIQEKFPWEAIKTNIFGTNNIALSSMKNNVKNFVLVSTDKAVMPVSVMGATKRLAEITVQKYNSTQNKTRFMAVRFGNVLGSSGSVIPIFQEQIKSGGPVTITDPAMERYFMSIPEASQLILQACSLGKGGEIFILDMGNPIKIIDLACELIKLSGYEPDKDIFIEITGVRPGEKKSEELSNPTEKLDKTKHDKIFVLNDKNFNFENFDGNINKIKSFIDRRDKISPSKVKSLLAEFLKEYKPQGLKISESFRYDNHLDSEA
jgi:FlaA1/EpsC-like NDP-sugar epimerase